jgi:hypothetical protein
MGLLEDFADLIEGGAEWLKEVIAGPLKDWAGTDVGKTILRAMATSLSGGLANVLGPQLASVAFALPGLARGEAFDEAWWKEFTWRVEKTAEILGPAIAEKIQNELKAAGSKLRTLAAERFPDLPLDQAIDKLSIGVEWLADELGIQDDVAAAALSLGRRRPLPPLEAYDRESGARVPLTSLREAFRRAGVAGSSVRAAIAGQGTQGSVVGWMRSIP